MPCGQSVQGTSGQPAILAGEGHEDFHAATAADSNGDLGFPQHRPSGPPLASQCRAIGVVARRQRGGLRSRRASVSGVPLVPSRDEWLLRWLYLRLSASSAGNLRSCDDCDESAPICAICGLSVCDAAMKSGVHLCDLFAAHRAACLAGESPVPGICCLPG